MLSSQVNPELLLKMTHLRGSITECILRNGALLSRLEELGCAAPAASEILQYHRELSSQLSELEMVLDGLRRRAEEEEEEARKDLGVGRLWVEAEHVDIRDLELIASTLHQAHDAILFARAPFLPLDSIRRLGDFSLMVHLERVEEGFVLYLKSPVLEAHFVPALLEIARAVGIGLQPQNSSDSQQPLGWGPALFHVRQLVDRSCLDGEQFQDELESIDIQIDDQLDALADSASLGFPIACLRRLANLLCGLIRDLSNRGHVRLLRLSSPSDEMTLLNTTLGRKRASKQRSARDVLRQKVDRFVRIQQQRDGI